MTEFSWAMLSPMAAELFLAMTGLVLLIYGAFRGDKGTVFVGWLSVAAFIGALGLVWSTETSDTAILNGMFVADLFAQIMKLLILVGLVFSATLSIRHIQDEGIGRFEYPVLMLFAGIGMMMMVSANDLLALYMGLELQSLALYVLASIRRDSSKSAEAGLKYFVLGAISSGMLLFGASLVYGYTGSTNFQIVGNAIASQISIGALIGMTFILAGLAFKISAVPFHMWTPDVYEGAPTSVTAFFAMVPKIAAIGLIIRLLYEVFPAATPQWQQIVWVLAALSMALGAFAGIVQENIKRLFAYSSIGNMGFALVGLVAANAEGAGAVFVYMMIYMAMTAGTFGIILSMRRDGAAVEKISDLAGMSRNHPVMAYMLAILMFSMSGIPPLAGFFGKLLVFKAAIGAGFYGLAVFGVLTSVVAAYYYLRIIKVMFFDEPTVPFDRNIPIARHAVVAVSAVFVLLFVFYPSPFVELGTQAAAELLTHG